MHDNNTFIYENHENCDNFENYDNYDNVNDNDKNFVARINLVRVDYRDENDDSDSDDNEKYDIDENQVGESWLQGCTAKPGMKGISSERIQQSQSNIKIIIIISVLSS